MLLLTWPVHPFRKQNKTGISCTTLRLLHSPFFNHFHFFSHLYYSISSFFSTFACCCFPWQLDIDFTACLPVCLSWQLASQLDRETDIASNTLKVRPFVRLQFLYSSQASMIFFSLASYTYGKQTADEIRRRSSAEHCCSFCHRCLHYEAQIQQRFSQYFFKSFIFQSLLWACVYFCARVL